LAGECARSEKKLIAVQAQSGENHLRVAPSFRGAYALGLGGLAISVTPLFVVARRGVTVIRIIKQSQQSDPMPKEAASNIGSKADYLIRLDRAGVGILDTIVLDVSNFVNFQNAGSVQELVLDQLLYHFGEGAFSQSESVALRPSAAISCQGMPEILFGDKSYAQTKYNIEKIYRSWSEERCKAYRASRHLPEAETWPLVIIQPKVEEVQTLICRSSRTGLRVSEEDAYNVHYSVRNFSEKHAKLAADVEQAVQSPVKIHFGELDKGILRVFSISDQPMLEGAKHAVLLEMLDAGRITDIEFLFGINFDIFVSQPGFYEDEYTKDDYIQGVAAQPGLLRGQIVFNTCDLDEFNGRSAIFTCQETSPEDVAHLDLSRGAMASTGGKASHLAVMCRGWGKPCVVGLDEMKVNLRDNCIIIRGIRYPVFHDFILSGTTGRLYLKDLRFFRLKRTWC
jgi:phosphoenolpyruvate synthase/pyruvate phosphate dikinase